MNAVAAVAESFRAFVVEVGDESPSYADWSSRVVEDDEVLARIAALPASKRQPNLVLAAARAAGATAPGPYEGFRRTVLHGPCFEQTVLARSTQTNEVGRLAVLTPLLAGIAESDGPLALVELGASAGLNLLPDRFAYRWTGVEARLDGPGPLLIADVRGSMPVPARLPAVAWRRGLDLHPIDVRDPQETGWLETLVWPEQEERRVRLRQAVALAAAAGVVVDRGDLLDDLDALLGAADGRGRIVVVHSAVVAYLDAGRRERFERRMRELVRRDRVRWISYEGEHVLPSLVGDRDVEHRPSERFVVALDGRAVARAHGHGATATWW